MVTFKEFLIEASTLNRRFHLKQHRLKGMAQKYAEMGVNKTYKRMRVFQGVRVLEAGRGWHAQRFYVLPENKPVIVEIVEDGWEHDKYIEVKIVSGGDQPAHQWAKRPYKSKKTGKTNPNVHVGTWTQDYMPNLENQYGFLGGKGAVLKKDLA